MTEQKEISFEFEDMKKGARLGIKAPKEVVDEYLDRYSLQIGEAFSRQNSAEASADVQPTLLSSPNDLPPKPETSSISEYLQAVLNSDWGKSGRTSTEILNLARTHSIPVTMSSLTGILYALNSTNKVTRMRGPNEQSWKYYPSREYSLRQNSKT